MHSETTSPVPGRSPPGRTTLAFVGDVMLGRRVSATFGERAPESYWGDTLSTLHAVDAVIANLECPITQSDTPWPGLKSFRFRAHPRAVDVLRAANIRCVNLANNHALDYSAQGLLDTLAHLDRGGIARTGAGRDLDEAQQPAVFEAQGRRVGVIGLTDNTWEFTAKAGRPGTHRRRITQDFIADGSLDRALAALRQAEVETVVLSVHWGPNLRTWPPGRFRRFARAAIERGVNIVHGHSAHLFQAVETYGDGLILYDTGNFIDDYWVFPGIRIDRSFIFTVELARGRPVQLAMRPVSLKPARVNLASGAEAAAIRDLMRRRCRAFGTALDEAGEDLVVRCGPHRASARHSAQPQAAGVSP
jgi:poly-gamma-glutamate synthesis protein (capsule biosynthesis protein)